MEQPINDVIIIGSGPAGYTAAIYTARSNLHPIVFEGLSFGGALMTTSDVENYPGFPQSITGPDLIASLREQAEKFGAELKAETVTATELTGDIKIITTDSGTHLARSVILAMGSTPRYLDVPGETELIGKGVSFCATCDGFFFKEHDIAVVGGGDTAMEEALFLTKFAKSVTIIHRSEKFRASPVMLDRAYSNSKISLITNHVITKIVGESQLQHVVLQDITSKKIQTINVSGLFIAIGHNPQSNIVATEVKLDEIGYIAVKGRTSKTNIPGVFAAGDIIDPHYQQAITAAGSGCVAALDVEHHLSNLPVTTASNIA